MAPQEARSPAYWLEESRWWHARCHRQSVGRTPAKRRVSVRALVRTDDERAVALELLVLRETLLQVVVGELLNIKDVAHAAQGVDYMFFTFAVLGGCWRLPPLLLLLHTMQASITMHNISLYTLRALKGIINNSQWCADLLSPSPVSLRHALSEAVFDAFPTPTVHLRGAIYHANLTMQFDRSAGASGVISTGPSEPYMQSFLRGMSDVPSVGLNMMGQCERHDFHTWLA
ncbi:g6093 [Coccomyxa elongata]